MLAWSVGMIHIFPPAMASLRPSQPIGGSHDCFQALRDDLLLRAGRCPRNGSIQESGRYDAAKMFMDNLDEARFGRKSAPMVYPNTDTIFYFVDTKDQDAFDRFM